MKIARGDCRLELHELRGGDGTPLLLLHPLYESSSCWPRRGEHSPLHHWPGPVLALDFAGHGESDWLHGGSYASELFAGDADGALAQIGPAALLGAGLGAYVTLLLAGARPSEVAAALLLPGTGLAGGGAQPDFERAHDPWGPIALGTTPDRGPDAACDPMLCCIEHEVRPVDYAHDFAAESGPLLLAEDAAQRPPWWETIRRAASARPAPTELGAALSLLQERAAERPAATPH
jgi:pimeloyl-ACP methyl ester carboxylesterase